MAKSVIIHLAGEDPIAAEMDDLPNPTSSFVVFTNPRKRDGKAIHWVSQGATSFCYPWSRINFIEIMTSEEERRQVVEIFRER